MRHYDSMIIGHISKDIIVTPQAEEHCIGGAVLYSSVAAKSVESNVLALTKLHPSDLSSLEIFQKYNIPILYRTSQSPTTSIKNIYFTEDRERRECKLLSQADPFSMEDIPLDIDTDLFYLGGLIYGEFSEDLIYQLSKRGEVAVDAQAFLRINQNGNLVYKDWEKKKEVLPHISFFKTDAAEAEVLTGSSDPEQAAKVLNSWGTREVMVTSSPGVTVFFQGDIYKAPFCPRNLSGRTGRGDTCFSAYCHLRKTHSPSKAILLAAALTSLKMESSGPFTGSLKEVENFISKLGERK